MGERGESTSGNESCLRRLQHQAVVESTAGAVITIAAPLLLRHADSVAIFLVLVY